MAADHGYVTFWEGNFSGHSSITYYQFNSLLHEFFQLLGYLISAVLNRGHHAVEGSSVFNIQLVSLQMKMRESEYEEDLYKLKQKLGQDQKWVGRSWQ